MSVDPSPSGELVRHTPVERPLQRLPVIGEAELERTWRVASSLAKSGMFKDVRQAEQAFAKILIGRDLGISPTRAMLGIDIVRGNVMLRGVLLGSFVRQHPDYEYKILENTHVKAVVQFLGFPAAEPWDESMVRHRGQFWEVLGVETFTVEDADQAKLRKDDSAWTTHPKNMCVWRALSNGVKFHMPELLGGIPVYTEGEIEPATTMGDQPQVAAPPAPLPERITSLLARVHEVDSTAWRPNEVLARLPHPDDPAYVPTLDGIVVEIERWLSEREEVADAEVVPEGESIEQAEAVEASEPLSHDDLLARYQNDEQWREQVDVLLNRRVALEDAVEHQNPGTSDQAVEDILAELGVIEDNLLELDVPAGWLPVSAEQTALEV